MTIQLSTTEIQQLQQILADEESSQKALITLQENNGYLEASFDELWQDKFGKTDYGKNKSLLQLTLQEIRKDICSDDGLKAKIKQYIEKPNDAPLLKIIITSLVTAAAVHGIPLDGAIATIVVLYSNPK